jgi:hypothetical protein
MATNLELLESAGLIQAGNLPSATDVTTINNLSQSDVQGLINVFKAVGSPFLVTNCNPGGSVAPGSGGRTIGIVF